MRTIFRKAARLAPPATAEVAVVAAALALSPKPNASSLLPGPFGLASALLFLILVDFFLEVMSIFEVSLLSGKKVLGG